MARSINHPHVARLLEVRESDGEWLLFSQYVAAGTLAALLDRRGPLSLGELVTLISPLAQGLAAMHRAGLIHGHLDLRDVMFDADGRPVITDAGLRLQEYPGSPLADLSALATIAHQAGGSPADFPDTLFTGDGDQVSRRILYLAPPLPIDLGQTPTTIPALKEPTPSNQPPPTPTQATHPGSPPVDKTPASETAPHQPAPTPAASQTPTHPESADDAAAGSVSINRASSVPASTAPALSRVLVRRSPATRRGGLLAAGKRSSRRRSTGGQRGTGRAGLAASGVEGRTGGAGRTSGPGGVGGAGRMSGPGRLGGAGRVGRTGRMSGAGRTAGAGRARQRRLAYGVLVVSGLVAVGALAVGLVGVLGKPATGSTVVANEVTPNNTPNQNQPPDPKPSTSPSSARVSHDKHVWLRTLQALDTHRARAFSTWDRTELDKVYVPGSAPWTADRSLLASYQQQRIRVDGLREQIEDLVIEHPGSNTVVLRIVDRLVAGAAITSTGQRTPLPRSASTARRITLQAGNTTWRISAITAA